MEGSEAAAPSQGDAPMAPPPEREGAAQETGQPTSPQEPIQAPLLAFSDAVQSSETSGLQPPEDVTANGAPEAQIPAAQAPSHQGEPPLGASPEGKGKGRALDVPLSQSQPFYPPQPLQSQPLPAPLQSQPLPAPLQSQPLPAPLQSQALPAPLQSQALPSQPLPSQPLMTQPLPSQESVANVPGSQRTVRFSQAAVESDERNQQMRQSQQAGSSQAEGSGSRSGKAAAAPSKRQRINFEERLRADMEAAAAAKAALQAKQAADQAGAAGPSEPVLRRSSADHYFEAFAASSASRKKQRVTSDALISDMLKDLTAEMVAELYNLPADRQRDEPSSSAPNGRGLNGHAKGKESTAAKNSAESAFNTQALEDFSVAVHRRTSYPEWTRLLSEGYKLLFHGVGTPEAVLTDYVEQRAEQGFGTAVVVRGYMPGLRIEKVLEAAEAATVEADEHDWGTEEGIRPRREDRSVKHSSHLEARAHRLREQYSFAPAPASAATSSSTRRTPGLRIPPLYLLLLGIDNKALMSARSQQVLGILAQAPGIYLLSSTSHINSALLLSTERKAAGGESSPAGVPWLWQDLNTFVPPVDEMLVSSGGGANKGITLPRALSLQLHSHSGRTGAEQLPHAAAAAAGATADGASQEDEQLKTDFPASRAISILESVTLRAKKLFRIILVMQFGLSDDAAQDAQPPRPVLFTEVLDHAVRDLLATGEQQMRALLPEFTSHSLVRSVKWSDTNPQLRALQQGKEYLWVNMARPAAQTVYEHLSAANLV